MKKDYKVVNEEKMTVTVSKDFLKKAGQFGTPEFYESLEMRQSGLTIVERKIKRNPEKQTYGRLTYATMRAFIEGLAQDEEKRKAQLSKFEKICAWAKTQKASYAKVKQWFLTEYKKEFTEKSDTQSMNA